MKTIRRDEQVIESAIQYTIWEKTANDLGSNNSLFSHQLGGTWKHRIDIVHSAGVWGQ